MAPLDGISISELNEGDLVGVKVIDDRPLAEYISTLLEAKDIETGNMRIVFAVLKEVKISEDRGILVTVEFGPGIYGRAYYGEDVKVGVAKKEDDEKLDKKKKDNFLTKKF